MIKHTSFGPDYYCKIHSASFEPQEAQNGDCPWCGAEVEPIVDQQDTIQ